MKSDDSKVSVCFQDGDEAVNIMASFNLSLLKRTKKVRFKIHAIFSDFLSFILLLGGSCQYFFIALTTKHIPDIHLLLDVGLEACADITLITWVGKTL